MAITPRRSDKASNTTVTDTDLRMRSQDLGMLGKLFGGRDQAPINIAGTIIVVCVMGLMALPVVPDSANFTKADMAKSLGSLILAALTFLGGYLGASNRHQD